MDQIRLNKIKEIRDKANNREILKSDAHVQLHELGLTKQDIAAITHTRIQNVFQNIQTHKLEEHWDNTLNEANE